MKRRVDGVAVLIVVALVSGAIFAVTLGVIFASSR